MDKEDDMVQNSLRGYERHLKNQDGEPPLDIQKYMLGQCRKWNFVWVGKNKVALVEPDEMEIVMRFPRNHTRGVSRTERYKTLGNTFQERIKRMQSVFNRERNKNKRSYESWRESGPGVYHQHFQREDWYWKTDTSYRDQRTNFRGTPRDRASYALSHHYSVLGLDRLRTKPYTDDEIKKGRTKLIEGNPDKETNDDDFLW
ncbi:DNA (cytosine-5)-methyltransferase DRM2, partial [Camellia lanceoleosa]